MKSLGLKVLREEELVVKTFGSREPEIEMRKVYAIPLVPVNGGKSITMKHFQLVKFLLLLISILKILRMYILI